MGNNRDLGDELVVTVVATGLELRTKEDDSELAKAVLEQMKWGANVDNEHEVKETPTSSTPKETPSETKAKTKSSSKFPSWVKGNK